MREIRKTLAFGLSVVAAFAVPITAASAACNFEGTWHVFLMQSQTPNIKSVLVGVRNQADTGTTFIKGFPPNDKFPYDNHTALAIQCKLVLDGAGRFSDNKCSVRGVAPGDNGQATVGGRVIFGTADDAPCMITGGTLTVSGDPTNVVFIGGYVNGNHGAGIARQGTGSVFLFNMIKH